MNPRRPVGVRMVTPGDWSDLDLDPTTRHRSIRRAVRRAAVIHPDLAGRTARLISILDDVAATATQAGAFFCSSLVLPADAGLLLANVVMQLAPSAQPEPAGGSAAQLCAGLAAAVTCDREWADATVTVVTLPAIGPAVRVESVAAGVCVQYLVPVAELGGPLVVTFTSPCPQYVAASIELFDSMAATLSLERAA